MEAHLPRRLADPVRQPGLRRHHPDDPPDPHQGDRALPRPLRLPGDLPAPWASTRPASPGRRPASTTASGSPTSSTTGRTPIRCSTLDRGGGRGATGRPTSPSGTHDIQMSRGAINMYHLFGLMPIGDTPAPGRVVVQHGHRDQEALVRRALGRPGHRAGAARHVANLEKRLAAGGAPSLRDPQARVADVFGRDADARAAGADHRRPGQQRRGHLPGQRAQPGGLLDGVARRTWRWRCRPGSTPTGVHPLRPTPLPRKIMLEQIARKVLEMERGLEAFLLRRPHRCSCTTFLTTTRRGATTRRWGCWRPCWRCRGTRRRPRTTGRSSVAVRVGRRSRRRAGPRRRSAGGPRAPGRARLAPSASSTSIPRPRLLVGVEVAVLQHRWPGEGLQLLRAEAVLLLDAEVPGGHVQVHRRRLVHGVVVTALLPGGVHAEPLARWAIFCAGVIPPPSTPAPG